MLYLYEKNPENIEFKYFHGDNKPEIIKLIRYTCYNIQINPNQQHIKDETDLLDYTVFKNVSEKRIF